METSVNNKCKAFTSLEQSNKLAKILPLESADMYWDLLSKDKYAKVNNIGHCLGRTTVYAWSLTALLDILPYPQLSKDKLGSGKDGWMVSVYPNDCRYDSCWHDNQVDACYEMVIKLNELKMI
jgi:hypothetical protein